MNFSLIIPVHNEEICLKENVEQTLLFLNENFSDQSWEVMIAENGSIDATKKIAENLTKENPNLRMINNITAGKGLAIRTAWNATAADRLIFMDADLATDLKHLPELINALNDHDLVIGTRRHPTAQVERSIQRNLTSFLYNWLAQQVLHLPFSDLQCGFKGIKKDTWQKISPYFLSDGFFFDTELLALAHKFQLKTHELPIKWQEKRIGKNQSKVKIFKTGKNLIKNLLTLKKRLNVLK